MVTLIQGIKTVTAAGTAERLIATTTVVEAVEIVAQKSTTVDNTGDIYIGFTGGSGKQYKVLTPGKAWSLNPRTGNLDLSKIWVDAETSADGVSFTAIRP